MTPIEIFALVFAVLVLVKLIILAFKPESLMGVAESLLKGNVLTTIFYIILLGVVGYFVFTTITVIQVAAVILFLALLVALTILPYTSVVIKTGNEIIKQGISKAWLAILLWVALSIWVIYSLIIQII